MAYRAGRLEIERADSQTIPQVTGSIDWKPREKIQVKLEAGVGFRNSGDDTNATPVLNGRIDWTPREGTELFPSPGRFPRLAMGSRWILRPRFRC